MSYIILIETPTPIEYCELRKAGGLSEKTIDADTISLPKSLFSVVIRSSNDNELIGMGRVVGDLGCHVQICDIVVNPNYQKRGFSKLLMQEIMKFVEKEVHQCAFVNLFADVGFLYERYGFIKSNQSIGMYLYRKN